MAWSARKVSRPPCSPITAALIDPKGESTKFDQIVPDLRLISCK